MGNDDVVRATRTGWAVFLGALISAVITGLFTAASEELAPKINIAVVALTRGQAVEFNETYTALISNDEGGTEPARAEFTLTKNNTEVVGAGGAPDGAPLWRIRGYYNGDNLVLSYRSIDPVGIGFGTYFLEHTGNDRTVYVGRVEGNSCPGGRHGCERSVIVRCNVIFVRDAPDGPVVTELAERYREFLAPSGCAPDRIVLPGEVVAPAAAPTEAPAQTPGPTP